VNKFLQDEKGNMIHASCRSIATKIARSPKTVCNNLNEHNDSIEQYGFCERCKRINSSLATILSPMKKHKQGDSE
jgi:hypothetical protein